MPVNDLKKQTEKPFLGNKNKARESKVRGRVLEMKQPKKRAKPTTYSTIDVWIISIIQRLTSDSIESTSWSSPGYCRSVTGKPAMCKSLSCSHNFVWSKESEFRQWAQNSSKWRHFFQSPKGVCVSGSGPLIEIIPAKRSGFSNATRQAIVPAAPKPPMNIRSAAMLNRIIARSIAFATDAWVASIQDRDCSQ